MTRHKIKSVHYIEPYCFESEQEEKWYKIGLREGVELAENEIISDIEAHISEMTVSEHDRTKLLDELKQIIRNGKIQHWFDYIFEDEVVTEDKDIIKNIEVMEPFKIKKGDIFQCIKDVVMADGVIDYKKGSFYTSDCDGCITDEQHTEGHYWVGDDDPSEYFIKVDSINDSNDNKYNDNVNHPKHYTSHPSGVECIDIARHYDFCIGNAIKYLWRAGLKSEQGYSSDEKQIEDLKKAIWYIQEKINMLEK